LVFFYWRVDLVQVVQQSSVFEVFNDIPELLVSDYFFPISLSYEKTGVLPAILVVKRMILRDRFGPVDELGSLLKAHFKESSALARV